jgi:beta-1,4-mannosyltransferase
MIDKINIAYYPSHAIQDNPYFDLYHGALKKYGIGICNGSINNDFLRSHHEEFGAFHIQWGPENIWRLRGYSTAARARGVFGLMRFCRLSRSLGIKLLWTVHDLEHHEGSDSIDRWGHWVLSKYADLIICHSDWCRHELMRRFSSAPSRILVIPHGNYDGAYPQPRPREIVRTEWGLDLDSPLMLCFGLIRPYKGYDLAIDVMNELGDRYQLLVAGHPTVPDFSSYLKMRAQKLKKVRLHLQKLTIQQVADLLHATDCILFPYRKITGSGALSAALTFERGVVVSDLPYFQETLAEEQEAGEFFSVGDACALESAIVRFFSLSIDRRQAAARRLADLHSWDRVVKPVAHWVHENVR